LRQDPAKSGETALIRTSLLVLTCLALPAVAQDVDCRNTSVQMELNLCAEQDWQAADARLNRVYKATMAAMKAMDQSLPPDLQGAAATLRDAQRAWIAFRDKNCNLAGYPMRGGSAEPLLIYGCLRQMTEDRTAELQELTSY
jgi:uncharacterized protein YecT (DUF1311 family)